MKKVKKAFTLIELLVVIAIIAILAAVIAPNAFKAIEKSKVSKVKAEAKALRAAALSYYADMGFFPPDVNRGEDPGLYTKTTRNLTGTQPTVLNNNWRGPYLDKWPSKTPWGGKYDWNLWKTSTSRYGTPIPSGIYIGITPDVAGSNTTGKVPKEVEESLIAEGFDVDGKANGEILLLLVKGSDFGF